MKAAAKAARETAARSAAAASLTEEELTALLKARQDAAAAAAAKEAADAEAARAADEAEEAAAPAGGARAATGATAPAATAVAPAGGDSEAAEARIVQKLFSMIKESGVLPTAPGKPAAVGGPERPAAEGGPASTLLRQKQQPPPRLRPLHHQRTPRLPPRPQPRRMRPLQKHGEASLEVHARMVHGSTALLSGPRDTSRRNSTRRKSGCVEKVTRMAPFWPC